MSRIKAVLDALSSMAPDVFQAEVAAGIAYAVILFHLRVSDDYRAALLGAAVLVFTILQVAYKASKSPAK